MTLIPASGGYVDNYYFSDSPTGLRLVCRSCMRIAKDAEYLPHMGLAISNTATVTHVVGGVELSFLLHSMSVHETQPRHMKAIELTTKVGVLQQEIDKAGES
jgi:hypothetical protein